MNERETEELSPEFALSMQQEIVNAILSTMESYCRSVYTTHPNCNPKQIALEIGMGVLRAASTIFTAEFDCPVGTEERMESIYLKMLNRNGGKIEVVDVGDLL